MLASAPRAARAKESRPFGATAERGRKREINKVLVAFRNRVAKNRQSLRGAML
jgi:hypothetical protein